MAILTIHDHEKTVTVEFDPPSDLYDVLQEAGIFVDLLCAGQGICGKCKAEISGDVSAPNAQEIKHGTRLICQTVLLGDAEVHITLRQAVYSPLFEEFEQEDPSAACAGIALDIGTTTISLYTYALPIGQILGTYGCENPQRIIGSDVLSRIQAAMEGKGPLLQELILNVIPKTSLIKKAVIVGNTAMLYFLLGKDPSALSRAPFKADDLFGRTEDILGIPSYLPPCMNAFVGADTTAGVLFSGMCDREEISLLADIGTNGELALWKDGTLYVTSTAAGPAFEGAGISQGSGAIPGSIDKVRIENGAIRVHVIGEDAAKSICGSGLLDAVAAMLALGVLDESGAMEAERFPLTENVSLTRKDIRSVQLAKGAVRAGIETLAKVSGTALTDITTLYLAGNFGSHLSVESAAAIGLIPPILRDRVKVLGNAALKGAGIMLLDPSKIQKAERIASLSRHVDLGGNPLFNELFVEHMLFGE